VDDAIIAVQMVDASMSNSSILGTGNTPMAEFPSDAEDAMEVLRSRIKKTLKIKDSDSDDEEEADWDGGNSQASNASTGSTGSRWETSDAPVTSHHFSPHHNRYSNSGGGGGSFPPNQEGILQEEAEESYFSQGQDPHDAEVSQASGYGGGYGGVVSQDIDGNGGYSQSGRVRKKQKKNFE
jgi:hypothetical protein